jgi:hypothetical protein
MFRLPSHPLRDTVSTFRRRWRSRYAIDPAVDDRLEVLQVQSIDLHGRIDSLEEFIVSAPKLAREERLHSLNTVPAPDELVSSPQLSLSRLQAVSIRRNRYRQLLHFVVLLTGLAAVLTWLGYQLTAGQSAYLYLSNF